MPFYQKCEAQFAEDAAFCLRCCTPVTATSVTVIPIQAAEARTLVRKKGS